MIGRLVGFFIGMILIAFGYWFQQAGYTINVFHNAWLWWFPTALLGNALSGLGYWMMMGGIVITVVVIISLFFRGRGGVRGQSQPVQVEREK